MYKDASNRVMEHPVGTGPYMLKQWTRGQRIVLEAIVGVRADSHTTELTLETRRHIRRCGLNSTRLHTPAQAEGQAMPSQPSPTCS